MHVMRGRPESAERHGAGHVARCTARAPHGRPGPARRPPCQVRAHHAQRVAGAVPGRPRQKAFQRVQAERAVGRRHCPASGRCPLLRAYVLRVGLRRLHHRPVLPEDHRLADHLPASVHRPGRRRPSDGRLAAETSGGRSDGPGAPPVTVGCSTGPSATGRPCPTARQSPRWGRRAIPFGFALAEALKLLVQGRADPQPGPLGGHRRRPCSLPPSGSTGTGTIRPHSAIGMRTPAEHEAAWTPDRHRHEQSQPATTGTR